MEKVYRILIIDDSALVRSVISDIIERDNRFEVADVAADGVCGLDMLIRNNGKYDIVLLDVNMPKMNGLDVLAKITKYKLKCKVIMVSTLVMEGANETIIALERGALDFVPKPSAVQGNDREDFGRRLIQSIEAVAGIDEGKTSKTPKADKEMPKKNGKENPNFDGRTLRGGKKLVVIACSTGGPKALKDIIPKLPVELDAPVVIVQHMPAGFTKLLADRMNELSNVTVSEAKDGETLKKGHVYIAPGSKQMRVINDDVSPIFKITDEEPQNGLKPCADIMYESLLEVDYDSIVCVVLTGMGSDGRDGIEKLAKEKETYVIAQNAATCVVYGMPKVIANAGLADKILPIDEIADTIIKNTGVLSDGH